MVTMSQLPIYKTDYFIHRIPSSKMHVLLKEKHTPGTNFNITPAIFCICKTEQPRPAVTSLKSGICWKRGCCNNNNHKLHAAGNACWVLHSNHLTDSNDSPTFLWKTGESKKVFAVEGVNADFRLPTGHIYFIL